MTRLRNRQRVYFIKPIGMDGPIKIGCSVAPDNRRETLETWAPFPLEIIAEIDGGFALERRFHTAFADSYIKHEWFRWSPELADTARRVAEGTFDIAVLPEAGKLTHFRAPRDNSIYTPEWRYQRSVWTRFQRMAHIKGPLWQRALHRLYEIKGHDRNAPYLPHRDELEALIAEMRGWTAESLAA